MVWFIVEIKKTVSISFTYIKQKKYKMTIEESFIKSQSYFDIDRMRVNNNSKDDFKN